MSLDPTWLFLSLIPSGIGFVLFVSARSRDAGPRWSPGWLTVYPYVATSVVSLVSVGVAVVLALWLALRAGW